MCNDDENTRYENVRNVLKTIGYEEKRNVKSRDSYVGLSESFPLSCVSKENFKQSCNTELYARNNNSFNYKHI